tara:strand:- start:189 stop:905 length:717 start_codon:yes stop_codon:yes gene_type:complete
MAVVNIYWSKNATAAIGPSGQNNFTNAREAEEATSSVNNTTVSNTIVSGFQRTSSRGGAAFGFKRSYWGFDFTGYTTGTITNLAFHYKPTTTSTGTLSNRLAQFEGFGAEVSNNFSEDEWWNSISDPLVPYTNAFNSADNSTATSVTLLSQATTDAKADGFLKLVLMNATDYNNFNLAVDVNNSTNWNIGSNTTGNIFLRFNYEAPGYGNAVIGVPGANIEEVIGVGGANIVSVIGVT